MKKVFRTPREFGDRYRMHRQKVYSLIESGELEAVDVSDGSKRPRWLIPEEAEERYLAKRTNKKPA